MADIFHPRDRSQRTGMAAVIGGFVYLFTLLLPPVWFGFGPFRSLPTALRALVSIQVGPWLWWGLIGGGLVGATLGTTVVHYGLISPVVVVAAIFTGAMYQQWQALQESYVLLPGTPYDVYFVGWPITLGLGLTAGGLEWLIQRTLAADRKPAADSTQYTVGSDKRTDRESGR